MVKSQRAKQLLSTPRFFQSKPDPRMKRCPVPGISLWMSGEVESQLVKNLSFQGEVEDFQLVLLEAMASLMVNRPLSRLDELSVRECEAFLRDKNSEYSLEVLEEEKERTLKSVFRWIRASLSSSYAFLNPETYSFPKDKAPFRDLKLVEKIKEMKAFLQSLEVSLLYQESAPPELLDIEGVTIYLQVRYQSEREKELFDQLHQLGVEIFREVDLNFIPEET